MGNGLAYLMLAIWPFVCLVLFRTQKVERALIWSILGGYLFLPPLTEFNLPLVPGMDKVTIPNLSVLLIMMFALKQKVQLIPQSRLALFLGAGLILSAIPTVLTNRDPIIFEVLRNADPILFVVDRLPGQSVRDIGSVLISQVLTIVPFVLARQFLSSDEGLREILLALMVGGLVYSVPSLIEIRLSPQMNVWIYGFFQHSFEQTIRAGGYRPIVFLPHGLWLALLVCAALMSAAALTRATAPVDRWKVLMLAGYLAMMLVLCKSFASLAYGLALTPLVLFAPPKWQIRLAAAFAFIAVAYPMLRTFQLVPLDAILAQAEAISVERAESLAYRFNNEEQLLARAAEKPAFGWGGWGRSLIRNPETGEIMTIPDGRWIIIFGTFGWLGYICEFGLLALPLVLMWWSLRQGPALSPYVAPLCLILGVTMIDMLLNATLTPWTWLTAGAILGHAEKRMPRPAKRPRFELQGAAISDAALPQGKRTIF
ncbi:Membrane protein [Sulfitobacter noctilucicola]|uniref:O-antigen ligase like membrane protein n=1 Tax=Sulfitobacter noctilucicola TaxID=1342301 RepID=A0A7W6M8I6_9RHOB|nr:membrane protein [Sulfitobacter noctilucicola]KIN64465.1 Membrane protein [Sulfitobacter noctilucicola]MBB4174375.1 hypothetical protein [Sulfitobacter noctilucicola]